MYPPFSNHKNGHSSVSSVRVSAFSVAGFNFSVILEKCMTLSGCCDIELNCGTFVGVVGCLR